MYTKAWISPGNIIILWPINNSIVPQTVQLSADSLIYALVQE